MISKIIIFTDLDGTLLHSETFEFENIRQYIKNKSLVRLDYITAKSNYYKEPGGLQTFRTKENIYNSIKFAIGGVGIFITILSLVVGGIWIMNIMFVSVKERTKEIGVRKAIGATKNMILTQFLMEATMICVIGGLIGLSFAYILSLVINQFFPSTMPIWLAITSISLSIFVGITAGLIPSYKAAGLDPIDALRYE